MKNSAFLTAGAVLEKTHPECGADEVFVTNADSSTFGQIG